MFPDDVLLEIFDLYVGENPGAWRSLVHVCRRWRWLVFASPRRLNVRIVCTHETPVRDLLDVWPAMPILVQAHIYEISPLDNVISVLGQRNRISGINLWDLAGSHLEKVLGAMKEPFPELVDLHLRTFDRIAPLDPDLFMGGSTPRLRYLQLERIPFPGLPKFLLSATHLVSLRLYDIPHSGYISPEAMVTCLAMLTSLETLCLEFQSLQSHLDCQWGGQRLPLLTRSVLPALMYFHFRGVSEYLEDLMSRVDAPRLNYMSINFAHEIGFDNPQLSQFTSRTPALKAPDEAHVIFDNSAGLVTLSSKASGPGQFNVEISCGALERRLSALTQVCNLSMSPLSTVQDLYLCENAGSQLNWDYPMESKEWLELLKPFTSVKNLYLSDGLRQGIAPALRLLVGDRVTEVLPTLESIFLGGPQPSGLYKEGIGQSISPAYPPNFYSQPWDSLGLDHQQNFTAPPPTPQLDWQNISLDGTQPSGHFQEDIWHDPQNLQLDYLRPSGPLDEDSEQHSSAQLLTLYNIYSEESQTSIPFQEGTWSDPQNVNLDWPQPSEPVHEDSQQHSSAAQSSTLQNLYSVESQPQPSGPFQKGDCPDLQNLHLGWSQPSELFHENFQYSSAQSSIMQNLDSQDSQPTRPLQEGCWPDPQNFHLDGSHWQPSGLFQWEECIGQFVAARQKAAHPITIFFWDRK
jgi:hypothetical protein